MEYIHFSQLREESEGNVSLCLGDEVTITWCGLQVTKELTLGSVLSRFDCVIKSEGKFLLKKEGDKPSAIIDLSEIHGFSLPIVQGLQGEFVGRISFKDNKVLGFKLSYSNGIYDIPIKIKNDDGKPVDEATFEQVIEAKSYRASSVTDRRNSATCQLSILFKEKAIDKSEKSFFGFFKN